MTPDFKPMLASPADFTVLRYPVLGSPKLDGIRVPVVNGRAVTRKLLDVPNRFIRAALSQPGFSGLDGEIIVGAPTAHDVYRVTNSAVMSHDGEPDFTFYVFDVHSCGDMPFTARTKLAEARAATLPRAAYLRHTELKNEAELLAYEAEQVALGYEGIMLRAPMATYKYGRSTAREQGMLKVKHFLDSEAEVIGVIEEMHNTNAAERDNLGRTKRSKAKDGLVGKGTMGALQARDILSGVEFEIGTGFTAAERAALWAPGTIVKYKYFPVGVKDKPRHPVFLGVRSVADMS